VTAADLPALISLIASQGLPNSCSNVDLDGDGVLDEDDVNATIGVMFGEQPPEVMAAATTLRAMR
jgi:hypothetical protein